MPRLPHLSIVAPVLLAIVAACGTAAPPPPSPPTEPPPVASATASAAPSAVAAQPAPTASASAAPSAGPPNMGNNTPIQASVLVADAKKLGIDFKTPLAKVPFGTKKKLMPLFVKALGYESCNGCHVEGDFQKETRNMKVARGMWDHFVVGLRDAQGAPMFCDACHNGKAHPLDRSAMDGLKRIMETDYQGKLTRADKKPHDCSACHGEAAELKIFEKLWGIADK